MPFSYDSKLPDDLKPSDRLGSQSAKALADNLKNTSNSQTSSGFQTYSGSDGKSVGVNSRSMQPPIWALITNITTVVYEQDTDYESWTNEKKIEYKKKTPCKVNWKDLAGKIYGHPYVAVKTYSWVEVSEDLNLSRSYKGAHNARLPFFNINESYIKRYIACYPIVVPAPSLNQGTVRKNPAYCINDSMPNNIFSPAIHVGAYTLLWYGSGPYMFFESNRHTYDTPHMMEQAYLWNEDHPN